MVKPEDVVTSQQSQRPVHNTHYAQFAAMRHGPQGKVKGPANRTFQRAELLSDRRSLSGGR